MAFNTDNKLNELKLGLRNAMQPVKVIIHNVGLNGKGSTAINNNYPAELFDIY